VFLGRVLIAHHGLRAGVSAPTLQVSEGCPRPSTQRLRRVAKIVKNEPFRQIDLSPCPVPAFLEDMSTERRALLAGEYPRVGDNLCHLPYSDRRRALEALDLVGPGLCTIRALDGSLRELLDACAELDVEGVDAKPVESPYRPGIRSGDWLKLKTADWKHTATHLAATGRRDRSPGSPK
jgi:hypothetical protein